MKRKYFIISLILFIAIAIAGGAVYFYCLPKMPKDPTNLQLLCFAFGFSFWPLIIGYIGIVVTVSEAIRSNLIKQSDLSAPNIDSEDQQLNGAAE